MDAVTGTSASATSIAAGNYALKKANDIQADSVTQLLNSVATPTGTHYNNPPSMGNTIDIKV
jgi:hypothetical protein